jgi:toxin CcdB
MPRFAVHANPNEASRKRVPYLLDVQSDLIGEMKSRVVVPLVRPERAGPAIAGLMPEFVVLGETVVMDTAQLAAVSQRALGKQVDDLARERPAVLAALDLLFSGV